MKRNDDDVQPAGGGVGSDHGETLGRKPIGGDGMGGGRTNDLSVRLPWRQLRNPILSHPDWSLKDACMVADRGALHIFCSAFDEDRSTVMQWISTDGVTWTRGPLHLTGAETQSVGVCSPGIVRAPDGTWVLHCNSWGGGAAAPELGYYLRSTDLMRWEAPRPLAHELTAGVAAVDVSLAYYGGRWMMALKHGCARIASARALDGPWSWVDGDGDDPTPGRLYLRRRDGTDVWDQGTRHENAQLFPINGRWHILTTDYPPHVHALYRMVEDPADRSSWAHFADGAILRVPSQRCNSMAADDPAVVAGDFYHSLHPCWDDPDRVHIHDGLANAGWLWDDRQGSGWWYLLYAAKNEVGRRRFNGRASHRPWPRGWNRLCFARSKDLSAWEAAPDA